MDDNLKQHLLKKIAEKQAVEQSIPEEVTSSYEDELVVKQQERDDAISRSNMGAAISTAFNFGRGGDKGQGYYDNLNKQANQRLDDFKGNHSDKVKSDRTKKLTEREDKEYADNNDPNSARSKSMKAAYKKLAPEIVSKIPDYDLLSSKDIKDFNARPIELMRKAKDARELAEQKAMQKKVERDQKEALEGNKFDAKIHRDITKENRKERRQLDEDYEKLNALETMIDDAIVESKKYNDGIGPGTGQGARAKDFLGALAPDTQRLKAKLNKLSLDQMVKQFEGMSRSIDTEADRRKFEATVPTIEMDDELLMNELLKRKQAARTMKQKIAGARKQFDKYGEFTKAPTPELIDRGEKQSFPIKLRKDGREVTVKDKQELDEARTEGWN